VRAAAFSTLRFSATVAASASRVLRFFSTLSGTNLRQGGAGAGAGGTRWRAAGAQGARRVAAVAEAHKRRAAAAVSPLLRHTQAHETLTTC
jgi:hypothetical protein